MRRTLTVFIFVQICVCVFLAVREFRDFEGATMEAVQAGSMHGFYVCTPAYQTELARKKNAGTNEVVITHADFQIEMLHSWQAHAIRRRNAFFFMVGLSGLSVLELVIHLRKPKGGA